MRWATTRAGVELVGTVLRRRVSPTDREARHTRAEFYRDLWASAADELGLPARPLPGGGVEITLGATTMIADKTPRGLESRQAVDRSSDKAATYALLGSAGLPVPPHATFALSSLGVARSFLAAAPGPCVVKPASDTSGGSGVTTGVRTPRFLLSSAITAAASAARMSRLERSHGLIRRLRNRLDALRDIPLLIEHQVPGLNYRLLYLDGHLIDAIRRSAPAVVGDGVSTVRELIRLSNRDRVRKGRQLGVTIVTEDSDLYATLASQELSLGSIPAAGAVVQVKTVINEGVPEGNWPACDELCAEIVAQGATAAAAVRARLAGVDIITTDPRVPLEASDGCVLEVNIDPGLAMHCHGHPGQIQPAVALLTRLLEMEGEPRA